jgi:hypothetical protein
MQEPFEKNEGPEEHFDDLRTENEIKKIKLALEHGMDLSNSYSDADLPPEVEGEFLDYMQQWEDQFAQRKMIAIYDFIDKPAFRPLPDIPEAEVGTELNRVLEILQQHSIVLDTLCDVADRELYRFITEELFVLETNDIRIEGMMHCYTYEEFHPNHEYDIKNRCTELINHITDKEKDNTTEPWGLADNISIGESSFTKAELNQKIINFRDSFSAFVLHEFEYTTINLNEEENVAEALAHIHYTGTIDGSGETMEFEGMCSFHLKCEYEWWTIDKLEMPWG